MPGVIRYYGVDYYTVGRLEMTVHFPNGKVICVNCPLCARDGRCPMRTICMATGEVLDSPTLCIGNRCPIRFEEEKNCDKVSQADGG